MPVHKINTIARAKFIRALLEGNVSRSDIAEETGLHLVTVSDEIRAYRKEGVVWRSGWCTDALGRAGIELFTMGMGQKDVPRQPTTGGRRTAKYRYRQRQRDAAMLGLLAGVGA